MTSMIVDRDPPAAGSPGSLDQLLAQTVAMGGSDLHLTVNIPPCVRLHGSLAPLPGWPELQPDDTERFVRAALSDKQWQTFGRDHEMDSAYAVPGLSRFRLNAYRQRGSVGAAFRVIPHEIP